MPNAGGANLTLAANFRSGDRCIHLAQRSDRRGGQKKRVHACWRSVWTMITIILENRRDHASSAVGRRCDHAAAGRVLLVNRDRVHVHIFHRLVRSLRVGLPRTFEACKQRVRPSLHLQRTRQLTAGPDPALDTIEHDGSDFLDAGKNFRLWPQRRLIRQNQFRDCEGIGGAERQQLGGSAIIAENLNLRLRCKVRVAFADNEPAADRVPCFFKKRTAV